MGYGGRTASSSVPDETVARLRASGGKAVPGAKPKQVEVEQLRAKRPAPKAEVAPGDAGPAAAVSEGNGRAVVEAEPAPAPEPAPAEAEAGAAGPEPAGAGLPTLRISRGATPQDIAAKISSTPAE